MAAAIDNLTERFTGEAITLPAGLREPQSFGGSYAAPLRLEVGIEKFGLYDAPAGTIREESPEGKQG